MRKVERGSGLILTEIMDTISKIVGLLLKPNSICWTQDAWGSELCDEEEKELDNASVPCDHMTFPPTARHGPFAASTVRLSIQAGLVVSACLLYGRRRQELFREGSLVGQIM